jgi:PEP-CTERM motif
MKRSALAFLGVLLSSVLASVQGRADTFDFNFSFTGDISGSGTFVAERKLLSEYLIVGVTGSVDGVTIASLLPPGTYPLPQPGANDNLLFYSPTATVPHFSLDGVSFEDTAGNDINLYFEDSSYNVIEGPAFSTVSFTLDAPKPANVTPEPATLVLIGTGAMGSLGMVRRRFLAKQ